jgi:hypothetical protein
MSRFHLHSLRVPLTLAAFAALATCGRSDAPTKPLVPSSALASSSADADTDDDDRGGGSPRTDDVQAVVALTRVQGRTRQCDGADGHYFENFFTLSGTSVGGTATDDRLTGDIEIRLHDLFNATKENGEQTGRVVIREHRARGNGPIKAEGRYGAWGFADMVQASLMGRTVGRGGSDRLYANMRITYFDAVHVAVKIGGVAADNRLPAGVTTGSCTGPFTTVDMELVPTTSLAAASKGSGSGRAGPYPTK